jgi:hypothetical protein
MPCRMAQRIECHWLQEIVIASALPNEMPVDVAVSALLIPALLLPQVLTDRDVVNYRESAPIVTATGRFGLDSIGK